MCGPKAAPAAPPPIPPQPPPIAPVLDAASGNPTDSALASSRGRASLRIDKTANAPGAAGNGLNIPS